MAALVFTDPELLAALNAIVHPLVGARTAALMAEAPGDAVVVNDVPLLMENGLKGSYDLVVVVDAPEDVRLERLVARGLSPADVRARMAAQASREDRLAGADYVIDNGGSLADLVPQVDRLWRELKAAEH